MLFFLHPEFLAIRPFTYSAPISVTFIKPNDSISPKFLHQTKQSGRIIDYDHFASNEIFLSFLNGDDFSKKRR
ncbi:hypothetical protein Syun_010475 [Stephania yunnanensis]|uniref:Uncharacterized protein n=1 Tax=Stephania yunnanensis TaxID=152371 RepID=A0AAP0KGI5_9MAGN